MSLAETIVPSPLGDLRLVASPEALVALYLPVHKRMPSLEGSASSKHPVLDHAARELAEYFAGKRRAFTVPLDARGTVFQRKVWQALTTIPYGARWTYGQLARSVGAPKGARAVGLANGSNPIPLLVPCHRVIGADGSLTGFGGGLEAKRWLLEHEDRVAGFTLESPASASA